MAYNRTLQHFTSPQELATLWATAQTYLVNQVVFQDNKLYRCLINHTSGTFQTDYANSNWVEISSGLVPWITGVYYTANQFVEQGNDIYRCLISHTSGTFATDLGAGKWVEVSAGSGSGLKNYVVNGDFEQNTDTGWSLANSTLDATTKLPNQVAASWTSAAGTLSKSVISSGQLAGTYSLQLSSTAATTAGDMLVTNALALDLEAQASVQTFSFFYKVTSNGTGTPNFSGTSANAIGVAIYDVTNSAWIQPAGVFNLVQLSGVGKASGTFQCPSNCTSVRLAVYFPNSTAASGGSPFTVVFDDFVLGPQVVQYGAPVTDWVSFTPTWTASVSAPSIGNGSITGKYRRVGDSIEVSIGLAAGTSTNFGSGAWKFAHPSFTIDTTKLEQSSTIPIVGEAQGNPGGNTIIGSVEAYSSGIYIRGALAAGAAQWSSVYPVAWASGNALTIHAVFPVSGLSSSVSMSNDTDTRVVATRATITSGGPFATPSVIVFNSKTDTTRGEIDTHSAYNTTTGVYTVPVSGIYQIDLSLWSGGGGTYLVRLEDGAGSVEYGRFFQNNVGIGGANISVSGSITKTFNAGDTFRIAQTFGTATWASDANNTRLSISRLSGPATIAASETVSFKAITTTTNVANLATQVMVFSNVTQSTHGAYSASTGVFTAPVSGRYQFNAAVALQFPTVNAALGIHFYKNGSIESTNGPVKHTITQDGIIGGSLSDVIKLNAGDTVDCRVYQTNASAVTVSPFNSSTFLTFFSGTRIGN